MNDIVKKIIKYESDDNPEKIFFETPKNYSRILNGACLEVKDKITNIPKYSL